MTEIDRGKVCFITGKSCTEYYEMIKYSRDMPFQILFYPCVFEFLPTTYFDKSPSRGITFQHIRAKDPMSLQAHLFLSLLCLHQLYAS
jgi:hypothetical protein